MNLTQDTVFFEDVLTEKDELATNRTEIRSIRTSKIAQAVSTSDNKSKKVDPKGAVNLSAPRAETAGESTSRA